MSVPVASAFSNWRASLSGRHHIIGVQKSDIFSGAPIQRQISAGGGAAVDFIVNRVDAARPHAQAAPAIAASPS